MVTAWKGAPKVAIPFVHEGAIVIELTVLSPEKIFG